MDDHKVHTLVSLAGPQMGVYGSTWLKYFNPMPSLRVPLLGGVVSEMEHLMLESFDGFAYTSQAQEMSSVANMWNDPRHQDKFLSSNVFLPFVNGLLGPVPSGMRSNFLRLKKAVFLTGSFDNQPYDSPTGLEPWCSGTFGFWSTGSRTTAFVPMESQKIFIDDTIGLRALNASGRLVTTAVANVTHGQWVHSTPIFKEFVLPHLI